MSSWMTIASLINHTVSVKWPVTSIVHFARLN